MNYMRLEQKLDQAYEGKRKFEDDPVMNALGRVYYSGMLQAVESLGFRVKEKNGKHIMQKRPFVEIYRNEDGTCDCELCELSAKCKVKGKPDRLPDPCNPERVALCLKLA